MLPKPTTKRWTFTRKASVVSAINDDGISIHEAIKTYGISMEEIESWIKLFSEFWKGGLKATRLQKYRKQ